MTVPGRAIPDPGAPAYDLARLRGFSDGVFAIAITVTVLQLVVPESDLANEDVLTELLDQWPIFLSLLVGFVVVGYYWLNHHRVFELLDKADGTVVWLNHLLLMFVVFLPFPTEMLGLYHEFDTSWVFFHLTGFVIGLVNSIIWFYATTKSRLVPTTLDPLALRIYRWRSTTLPAAFLLAAGVALIAPFLSLCCLLLAFVGRPLVTALIGSMPPDEVEREAMAQVAEDQAMIASVAQRDHSGNSMNWLLGGRSVSGLERLIAFTDGVYAISITLLGFQFLPPDNELTSNEALREYLFTRDLSVDLFLGYALGFLAVGLFWVTHHRYFIPIRGQDAGLRLLSLVHLFFIALLPDATEFLSVHHAVPASLAYYSIVGGMAVLTMNFLWRWASWHHHLVDKDLADGAIRKTSRLGLVIPAGFFAAIPLAFVVGEWAQFTWLITFVGLRVYLRVVHEGPEYH
jgi:uncharacterized membrane protein